MLVSFQDDKTGFGNSYGGGALVPGFTSQITLVPTSTTGDVTITLEYFGDFDGGSPMEALTVNIEGVTFGPYPGDQYDGAFGPASPSTVNLTIDQATWAAIIADGAINISYDVGSAFNNLSDAPGAEEFVRLTFAWDYDNLVKGTRGNDKLRGTAFDDVLRGRSGDDTLWGYGGDDVLRSKVGNDKFWGGVGADTFVYTTRSGRDTIMDFETGIDKIDLSEWKAIEDYADMKSHARNHGDDLWITAGKDTLIIKDFSKGELVSGDFLL